MVAQIQAPIPANEAQFGEAIWVKVFTTELADPIALEELVGAIRRSNRPSPRSSGNCCRQIRATRSNAAVNLAAAVPEPGTYVMLLAGLGLIGFAVHRRKRYMD